MENVLTAIIAIFLLLFAALSLSYTVLASQDILMTAQAESESRLADQAHTVMGGVDGRTIVNRELLEITLRNDGSTRLADFEQWDVFVSYDGEAGQQLFYYLGLDEDLGMHATAESVQNNEEFTPGYWAGGLYYDAAEAAPELIEPGIFNPGEELMLWVRVSPAVGPGEPVEVTLAAANGVRVSVPFKGNMPPEIVVNSELIIRPGGRETITAEHLAAEDDESPADDLVYTITDSTTLEGTLSMETFTQADIDAGRVVYTHTGTEDGSFVFSVTDGQDTLEDQTFTITLNQPPTFTPTSTDFPVGTSNTGTLTGEWLLAADEDNDPAELSYTVTEAPVQGYLNLGDHFTQADVDAGGLIYTRTGEDVDSFQFTISDGTTTIGTYTLNITAGQG